MCVNHCTRLSSDLPLNGVVYSTVCSFVASLMEGWDSFVMNNLISSGFLSQMRICRKHGIIDLIFSHLFAFVHVCAPTCQDFGESVLSFHQVGSRVASTVTC